mmetsp:Transcript_57208/g.145296  ORF Transcript_57208/g.145296 Transcript_57208/m.145296 type:complete len:279 (-) Transcript_57208:335-1171(-)
MSTKSLILSFSASNLRRELASASCIRCSLCVFNLASSTCSANLACSSAFLAASSLARASCAVIRCSKALLASCCIWRCTSSALAFACHAWSKLALRSSISLFFFSMSTCASSWKRSFASRSSSCLCCKVSIALCACSNDLAITFSSFSFSSSRCRRRSASSSSSLFALSACSFFLSSSAVQRFSCQRSVSSAKERCTSSSASRSRCARRSSSTRACILFSLPCWARSAARRLDLWSASCFESPSARHDTCGPSSTQFATVSRNFLSEHPANSTSFSPQ